MDENKGRKITEGTGLDEHSLNFYPLITQSIPPCSGALWKLSDTDLQMDQIQRPFMFSRPYGQERLNPTQGPNISSTRLSEVVSRKIYTIKTTNTRKIVLRKCLP